MLKSWSFLLTLAAIFLFTAVETQAQPVISITDVEITPLFPEPARSVHAVVTVKNIGDVATTCLAGLNLDIYSSNENGTNDTGDFVNVLFDEIDNIGILLPNMEATYAAMVPLYHVGPHTADAWLNTELCELGEIGILDGHLKNIFHVTRPADLVMDGIRLNNDGRIVLSMHNAGAAIPDDYFQASTITVNIGANTYTQNLAAADPTGRLRRPAYHGMFNNRVSYVWPASGSNGIVLPRADRHEVVATVDSNRSINDHRRSNNTRLNHVGGMPDLVVCFKYPDSSTAGRFNWYSPIVKNIGNARSGPANLRFYFENKGGTNHSIPSLPAGGKYYGIDRKVYWAMRGNRNFKITVDNREEVNELNPFNNIIEGRICVGPVPPQYNQCGFPPQPLCSYPQAQPGH